MAIRRDPETGQFVSPSRRDGGRRAATFSGFWRGEVVAADITSGTDTVVVDGTDATVLDFTERLDSDEVFEMHHLEAVIAVMPEATATAEHSYKMLYALVSDAIAFFDQDSLDTFTTDVTSPFNVEVSREELDDDSILLLGNFSSAGDFRDTATGTGGGSDNNTGFHSMSWPAMDLPPPAFDQDDELAFPHTVDIVASDDQGINVHAAVTAHGVTMEL